jgi:hypothetical protein
MIVLGFQKLFEDVFKLNDKLDAPYLQAALNKSLDSILNRTSLYFKCSLLISIGYFRAYSFTYNNPIIKNL